MVLTLIFDFIAFVCVEIYKFAKWFYLSFLPFIIQYIGIPLFFLGILLAIAFAGGTVLFTVIFFIFMFYFIKGTLVDTKPINLQSLV
jgi:hypothetical protein